jgi:exopolysaccharide production protein ExoY
MIEFETSELSFKSSKQISSLAKRAFDIMAASLLLLLFLPLLMMIALAVALSGGPVFYFSDRIGMNGIPFKCIKFRTMIAGADHCIDKYIRYNPCARKEWLQYRKLAFDPRVTTLGQFFRKSSIDELPQLINVIRGEMSLVGPRPVTQAELDTYYLSIVELYKSVRPGMTGLWQVSGRNDISYATRVVLDERYVRDWSFILDILILCKTPCAVISRRGAR